MKTKELIALIIGICVSIQVKCAPPTWSVNPSSFVHSMTITAVLKVKGSITTDQADIVGAFVGNEVRGVGQPSVFVSATGQYVVFMQVYSNKTSGEQITFKIYDSSADDEAVSVTTTTFVSDSHLGETTNPYTIADNNVPTALALSATSINEHVSVGTSIGTLSTTDADTDETFTYTLVSGTGDSDNGSFTINGNQLLTGIEPDFENKNKFLIRIRSTDSRSGLIEVAFEININDINEAPTVLSLSKNDIVERSAVGSLIGTFSTVDADPANTHTYTLASGGTDNASFKIVGNQLLTNTETNADVKSQYNILVRTDDGNGGTLDKPFTITIIEVNDLPTQLTLSFNSINEHVNIGTTIGTFSTADLDANETFTYTLVTGEGDADNGSFTISENKLMTGIEPDFEVKNKFLVRIRSTDSRSASIEASFEITINDINEAPTVLTLSKSDIVERSAVGSLIGTLSTVDADPADQHTYTLASGGTDNASFSVLGNQLMTNTEINADVKSQYNILIRTDDGNGGILDKPFSITIIEVNDLPTELTLSFNSLNEHVDIGTVIGTFSTADLDANETFTYTLATGDGDADNSSFAINGNELQSAKELDFEQQSMFNVRVRSTDSRSAFIEASFDIVVKDINEAPVNIALSANEIEENSALGSVVGSFSTEDFDLADQHTYTFASGGIDNNLFTLNGAQLLTNVALNAEEKASYNIMVSSDDGKGGTLILPFVINVIDVNEGPTIQDAEFIIFENTPNHSVVGTMVASDPDLLQTLTFAIISDSQSSDNSNFSIDPASGSITVTNTANMDYEQYQEFVLEVSVTDNGVEALSDVATVTIKLNDEIEEELKANNFISPNGDGFNDVFFVINAAIYSDYELVIYNSQGASVYQTSNYNNTWSATTNSGAELPGGIYYYSFKSDKHPLSFQGSITVVRN